MTRNISMRRIVRTILLLGCLGLSLTSAQADSVIAGGSVLLDQAGANQLAAWLGEGDLIFTNIFSKTNTNSSTDFHAAADFQGRTFTVLRALPDPAAGNTVSGQMRIGGYNPQSWDSSSGYHITPLGGTAFLFNLETSVKQNQNMPGEGQPDSHLYQTMNVAVYGPTFGGGHDLHTAWDNGFTQGGSGLNYSYGGTSYGTTITGDPSDPVFGGRFLIGDLEVFTIQNAPLSAIPEPGYHGALVIGVSWLVLAARRRHKP